MENWNPKPDDSVTIELQGDFSAVITYSPRGLWRTYAIDIMREGWGRVTGGLIDPDARLDIANPAEIYIYAMKYYGKDLMEYLPFAVMLAKAAMTGNIMEGSDT